MNLERIQIFYAVAKEKSFSKAAKRLSKTQSAISQSIRLLEQEIGDTLFIRNNRTVLLSEAGKILFEHAVSIVDSIEIAQARIDSLKKLEEGELIISSSMTSACYMLPEVLKKFKAKYPGVKIILKNGLSDHAAEMVANKESDVGIVMLPISNLKLESKPLVVREDVIITSINHVLSKAEDVSVKSLLNYEFILLDKEAHTRQYINNHFESLGAKPRVAMEVGNMEIIKQMVILDFGISVIPRIAVRQEEGKTLNVKRVFSKDECRKIGVVYRKNEELKIPAQIFVEMIIDHFKDIEII
ncbi:MAG: LysR family transcriptional regulator [Spirochaetales bacterium]|nr:LysR family transcriptional regulator [Spirochaetales bacterium]